MHGCHVSTTCFACQDNCSLQSSILNRHVFAAGARPCIVLSLMNTSRQCGRPGQPLTRQNLLLSQFHRASNRQRRVRPRGHAAYAAAASIKDPYKVLGVEISATDQIIKKAFKQKAKQLHPDVNKAVSASACDQFNATFPGVVVTHVLDCSQMPQTDSWNARWLTSC